jgi:hypothetical protein
MHRYFGATDNVCSLFIAYMAQHPAESVATILEKAVTAYDAIAAKLAPAAPPESATDVVVHDATWEEAPPATA